VTHMNVWELFAANLALKCQDNNGQKYLDVKHGMMFEEGD